MDQGQQQHQINTFKYGYGAEDDVSLAEPEIQHNLLYLWVYSRSPNFWSRLEEYLKFELFGRSFKL